MISVLVKLQVRIQLLYKKELFLKDFAQNFQNTCLLDTFKWLLLEIIL